MPPRTFLTPPDGTILHASTVAFQGHAALIRGASGSGKSGLALQLIALGADLVADDRTYLWHTEGCLMADAPDTIRGCIEARGIGILASAASGPARVKLIVDMNFEETERLPSGRDEEIMGVALPVIRNSGAAHFPAAILLYLKGGRCA